MRRPLVGLVLVASVAACGSGTGTAVQDLDTLSAGLGPAVTCDGRTDNTIALQARINAGNGVIPPGICMSGQLTVRAPITISGSGVLKASGTTSLLVVEAVDGFSIRAVTLAGSGGAFAEHTHLLQLLGVKNALVDGVTFIQPQGDAIYMGGRDASGAALVHNVGVTVRNSLFDGVNNGGRNGISVIDGDGLLIDHNTLRRLSRFDMPGPIDMEPNEPGNVLHAIVVSNNTITEFGGSVGGIAVVATRGPTPTASTISGNIISGGDVYGITYVGTGVSSLAISRNVVSAGKGCLQIIGLDGGTISDNDCTGARPSVLGISDPKYYCANVATIGNVFRVAGLVAWGDRNLTFGGNQFTQGATFERMP